LHASLWYGVGVGSYAKRKRRSEAHGESAALVNPLGVGSGIVVGAVRTYQGGLGEVSERIPTRSDPVTRRCKNCPKMFKATRVDHVFCSGQCRFQFHKHGNTAYGHVKHLVEKQMRAQLKEIEKLKARLDNLEISVGCLRADTFGA
jgi:hypothetical protein